jgi:hypothetical protein
VSRASIRERWEASEAENDLGHRIAARSAFFEATRQDIPALLAAMDGLVLALEQMEREHGHHNIPGSVTCYGCGSVAKARAALRDLEAQP